MIDQKGQALIENIVCFIAFKLFVVGFLLLAYQIALTKWVDFWSYRTLICMIDSRQRHFCQTKLEEKMSLLVSRNDYRINELWLTNKATKINMHVDVFPFGQKSYEHQVDLPLSPR